MLKVVRQLIGRGFGLRIVRHGLLTALILFSVTARGKSPCSFALRELGFFRSFDKQWARSLSEPRPSEAIAWLSGLFDPYDNKGDLLFGDPAFKKAYRRVALRHIEGSQLGEEAKEKLTNGLNALLDAIPSYEHTRFIPNERTVEYERALESYFQQQSFQRVWKSSFPASPDLAHVSEKITQALQEKVGADPGILDDIRAGVAPLIAYDLARQTFHDIALEQTDRAFLPDARKEQLRKELETATRAMEEEARIRHELRRNEAGDSNERESSERLSPEEQKEVQQEISEYLKSEKFRTCVTNPLLLVGATTVVNDGFGVVVLHDDFGDPTKEFWAQMRDYKTYVRATFSARLGNQLIWNALLMGSIGGIKCLNLEAFAGNSRFARWAMRPDNFNGFVVAPTVGALAQVLSTPHFEPGELVLNVLWIRLVSVNKTRFFTGQANRWRERGLPGPAVAYLTAQFLSESIGAILYPYVERLLFPNFGDDDKKKKQKRSFYLSDSGDDMVVAHSPAK